jgi:hypothetical protein
MKSLILLLVAMPLAAQSAWVPWVDLDLNGAVAPDGLQVAGAYGWRRTLAGPATDPAAYLQAGALASVTPAYGNAGMFVEWQPAPFLVLRVEQAAIRNFGQWGSLLSFESSAAPFGDGAIKARKGTEERAWGARTLLQMTPQVQVGQVVLRHRATLGWWRLGGRGPWLFEYENDLLLQPRDRTRDFQTFALWASALAAGKLYSGGTWQVTQGLGGHLRRRRLGLTAAFEGNAGRWGSPRAGLIVGRNQEDRNRQGSIYAVASVGTSFSLR